MRCTFYVDGDLLDPWEEDVRSGPPAVGTVVTRHGYVWGVRRVTFTDWPDSMHREASVWLVRASDLSGSDLSGTGAVDAARERRPD